MASFTRVSVDEMKFTPAHVEIVRGTSVRWEQSPKCVVRHCLEVVDPEENNQASSPALLPGEPWEHTFEACGDFHYRSLVYCFMKGTVKVVDAAPADVDADRADAPVKTRAIAVDATAAPATAAPASAAAPASSRDETPVPEPLFGDENVVAAECAAPPRPRSFTTNDPKPEPATDACDRAWHACDRCARVFVSSTNLKRHAASHGNRRSSRNASSARRSRRPKPPPASVDEIAAFFAGLSYAKKREALAAVAAPGSTGALVVHGIRARKKKREAQRDGGECRDWRSREGDCQSRETSPAVAYAAAGAAVAKVVETYSDTHETRTTVGSETSTSTESDITDGDLFDALAGASEGTCFGPRADVDPTTMCLDENLDAALAYCVEQALFVSYLEERSAEAEAARKTLLAEIDEQCAEEERRAARRAEARKAKKAKSRSARPRMSETETGITETETGISETEEARAWANAANESIESSRSDDGDDDRGGTVVPGGSRALSNASTPPPRETKRETQTRRTEVPGSGSLAAAEAERGACRRGRTDFRGDSAKGDGATPPAPLSAPRTTAPADAASAEKQKRKQNGNQKTTGNARPTTAPPSYHPPPNLPSASVAARRSPLAVPAPRRAASLASSSTAAIGDANDDAIARPRLEPASRFAPQKADGDAEKASVVSASAPRKSRRALKAARASARAEGDAEASASATEVESASGSDLGYKTASDTDFSSGRSRVASRVSSAAPSRNAEGGVESSTRRARLKARAATETSNANGPRIAKNLAVVPATAAGVRYETSAAGAPRNGSSRPAADFESDFEDAIRFASPAGTPATPVAMFASPPSAARAIPVAPVWTPEREFARMTMRPPAFAAAMPAGAPGMPPGVVLGAPPSHHHPMHQLHHPPPGIDPDVYMHHYATALAAIQASQAGAVAPHSGPGPAAPFAPPLPPGPPPHASRASR